MGEKVKIRKAATVSVKKTPVKVGSKNKVGGGIFTAKVAAIARKRRRKSNKNRNG